MGTVRLLLRGQVGDHEAHVALAKRMQAFVEQYEPETVIWEVFADDLTGRVVWHEVYASAEAYLLHVRNMQEQGFFDEFVRQTRLESVTSLEPLSDGRAWEQLRALHADFLHEVAAVTH